MLGVLECPLCGRGGGHVGRGEPVCTRCRLELSPSRLHIWRTTIGWSVAELAEATRVSVPTLSRVLRGDPVGRRVAQRIERVTRIPAAHLQAGEPSPLSRTT